MATFEHIRDRYRGIGATDRAAREAYAARRFGWPTGAIVAVIVPPYWAFIAQPLPSAR